MTRIIAIMTIFWLVAFMVIMAVSVLTIEGQI